MCEAKEATMMRPLGVRRVAEVGEHAFLSELGDAPQVHRRSLDGGKVDLVVSGEHDNTRIGADGYRDGAGYGVVYLDKLQAEPTQILSIAGSYLAQVSPLDPEFLQLAAH